MSAVSIVFPHQLSLKSVVLAKERPVVVVEEYLFFRQYRFHQQKLLFHRSSMRQFADALVQAGLTVRYIDAIHHLSDIRRLIPSLAGEGVTEVHVTDPTDNWLGKRLRHAASTSRVRLVEYESPLFLLDRSQLKEYFADRKSYFQTDFYVQQRKRFGLLVTRGKPDGGQWSYDADNRQRYPAKRKPPAIIFPGPSRHWQEARVYVAENFGRNYGGMPEEFVYPSNAAEARTWLEQFLHERFHEFGAFEDALVAEESILHHSVLTPMMNSGLLAPGEVIDAAVAYAAGHQVPLNSLEGFIRQIIGWREFIRGVYEHKGTYERTRNFWKFSRKIPASFWTGTTGIAPVDVTIRKVLRTGYCHHIERLMVLGNFMLLCEFDPDEVYRWFMEMFVDAYDWVMVPNVYGMSQFADGGLMATKPYISGSNYLMKMGNYEKGDWQQTWDGLFWRFMHVQRDFFLQNPRLGMLVRTFDKMSAEQQQRHLTNAGIFLERMDSEAKG